MAPEISSSNAERMIEIGARIVTNCSVGDQEAQCFVVDLVGDRQ
jgi:hypothetical protein